MKDRQTLNKVSHLNIFIFFIFLLFGLSIIYFFYFRIKNREEIYMMLSLRQGNTTATATSNWIPRWISDSIDIGDIDQSAVSGINAYVTDKVVYDTSSYGNYIYLTLKANVIRDRSGTYLFKNKPLLIGSNIDLNLNKTQVYGVVIYIGELPPNYDKSKYIVKIKATQLDPWIIDAIKIGDTIKNNKGDTEVVVKDKIVNRADAVGMRYESHTGRFIYDSDPKRADLELTLEINGTKMNDEIYYAQIQRLKVNEWLNLSFNTVNISAPIIFISPFIE